MGVAGLSLAALGVVFGDIGTSPLYTLKTVLDLAGGPTDASTTLGALSLIWWTLFIVVTMKYVNFAMRIGNDGEGGIIALLALLGVQKHHRPAIVAAGLFGAALIYGDGTITPAISVLSALEGLQQLASSLQRYVLPLAVVILFGLFALQPLGVSKIGRAFGPIMLVWFLVMAILGLYGITRHPGVLVAVNPVYGVKFLATGGARSFLVLGGIFLCVTGAEALYADMGQFGTTPIRRAWNFIVFPSLLLNYAGQAAIVLEGAPREGNIFYQLCPAPLLAPLIVLATIATIIASQSIITGAFSMTRQAIVLGWLPRLRVTHTSEEGYGQIYVGAVNWLLMIATLGVTLGFGKSGNLASAYGIAVSLTMLITGVLLFIAMREIWHWPLLGASSVAIIFVVVDLSFVLANMAKVRDGGYVPLLLAVAVFAIMWIWHRGMNAVSARTIAKQTPLKTFLQRLNSHPVARVPGSAVFLTRSGGETPLVMEWQVKQNRSLHEYILVLTIAVTSTPHVKLSGCATVHREADKFWRAEALYGFMERPDVMKILRECKAKGAEIDLDDVTFYVGRATILPQEGRGGIPRWQEAIFSAMERNSSRITDILRLPHDQVVEIGREIAI
ncbi:MAG TPA: KUP/HAK/KT family potassium transporter [Xanthobacteraceae bacterium]|nr:KUP/HAK/KT family potassium transporter [Xanthobacteraceae bacterium]